MLVGMLTCVLLLLVFVILLFYFYNFFAGSVNLLMLTLLSAYYEVHDFRHNLNFF